MQIRGVIWLPDISEKISVKHGLSETEVEEVFMSGPHIRFAEGGDVEGEDVYFAYGQTMAGQYLFVVFIYKKSREALILSARKMTRKERRYYAKTRN
ncbi:MAG: BrnT family toxin [bacterium]|nr:BrnT family toxin [bacterium]